MRYNGYEVLAKDIIIEKMNMWIEAYQYLMAILQHDKGGNNPVLQVKYSEITMSHCDVYKFAQKRFSEIQNAESFFDPYELPLYTDIDSSVIYENMKGRLEKWKNTGECVTIRKLKE